jgi:outer membrane protein
MKRLVLLIMVVWVGQVLCSLDLEQSITLARENNKSLLMAKEEIKKVDQNYYDVRGNLFPHLTLSGGYSLTRTYLPDSVLFPSFDFTTGLDPATADYNDYYLANSLNGLVSSIAPTSPADEGALGLSLDFTQVVFMGGKLINGIKAVGRYRSIQHLKYDLTEQEVVLTTTQMFYGCLLCAKLVEVQEEGLQTAKSHLQRAESFAREGMVAEFDILRAKLEVAKLEPQLIQAQNSRDLALSAFRKQIGDATETAFPEGEFVLPDSLDMTLEQALELGTQNRLELELADIATNISRIKWQAERSNFMPTVAIQGNAALFTKADGIAIARDDFGTNYSIGIGFSLPLFDGLSNLAKRRAAQHEYQYSQLQQDDFKDKIRLQITQAWQNLRHAWESYQVQEENIALAQRGLQLAQIRYDNQVGIQLEVFDAQTLFSAIKLQYYQSIYEVIAAQREFQKAIGSKL